MKLSYSSEMFKFHLQESYYRVEMSFDSCLKLKYLNIKTKTPWNRANKHKHIPHLWGRTLPVIYCSYYLHTYQTKLACSYLGVFTQDSRSVCFVSFFLLDVSLSIHHPWETEWKALTALKGLGQQRQRNGLKPKKTLQTFASISCREMQQKRAGVPRGRADWFLERCVPVAHSCRAFWMHQHKLRRGAGAASLCWGGIACSEYFTTKGLTGHSFRPT